MLVSIAILLAKMRLRTLIIFLVVFALVGLVLGLIFLFRYCRLRLRDMNECPDFLRKGTKKDLQENDSAKP